MAPHRLIGKLVMVLGMTLAPTLAFAQPGQTSLVSAQESGSYTFTFARVAGATHYYLWVNEGGTPIFQKWFTAAEVRCAGTEVNCFIAVALPRAAVGTHAWWVQTYGPSLYGPWSAQGSWASRPPTDPTAPATTKTMPNTSPAFVSIMSLAIPAGDAAGVRIYYTIVASDGTTHVVETGVIKAAATANSITCTAATTDKIGLGTVNSGCTPGFISGSPSISIFDNVSLPNPITLHKVSFRIENLSSHTIRLE